MLRGNAIRAAECARVEGHKDISPHSIAAWQTTCPLLLLPLLLLLLLLLLLPLLLLLLLLLLVVSAATPSARSAR